MTNEQLIIYLYGIYPEGGLSVMFMGAGATLLSIIGIIAGPTGQPELAKKWLKVLKPFWVITGIVVTIGYFIPSKNTFLAIVATPSLIQSLENSEGKLFKVNKLLNEALDVATEAIEDRNSTKER